MLQFEKPMQDLSDSEVIKIHLQSNNSASTHDYSILSTLAVLNQEVNFALTFDRSKNILPIMGAMTIIEQLGECYKRKDMEVYPNDQSSSLIKGLYYFGEKGKDDPMMDVVYALRNSLLHNASFYSKDKYDKGRDYNFTYDHEIDTVYKAAEEQWHGEFENISEKSFTLINPNLLVAFAGQMIYKVSDLNDNGNLEIVLDGGKNELIYRYLKWKSK